MFGRVEEEEPSNIVLQKTSSDSDMRWAYSAFYNLHETASGGTVNFRMYSDKACTQRVKVYTDAERTNELDPIPIGRNGVSGLYNKTVFYCEPGTVYLKELTTPKVALVDKKELTAQAEFTPDQASGSIELTFTFKADDLGGKNLVAFEELYLGNTLVASHTDIKDEAQTVTLEKPAASENKGSKDSSGGKTSYSNPKTGDNTNLFLFLIPRNCG